MFKVIGRIHQASAHRRRVGAMPTHKLPPVATSLVVQHRSDVALLPQLDVLGLMVRHQKLKHLAKTLAPDYAIWMRELQKFQPFRACRIGF